MFDSILDFFYDGIEWAMSILPDSPFQTMEMGESVQAFSNVMSYVNYFVPVSTMLGMLTTFLIAVGLWYVVRWLLRLAQYI